jgi:hypothetical protein
MFAANAFGKARIARCYTRRTAICDRFRVAREIQRVPIGEAR